MDVVVPLLVPWQNGLHIFTQILFGLQILNMWYNEKRYIIRISCNIIYIYIYIWYYFTSLPIFVCLHSTWPLQKMSHINRPFGEHQMNSQNGEQKPRSLRPASCRLAASTKWGRREGQDASGPKKGPPNGRAVGSLDPFFGYGLSPKQIGGGERPSLNDKSILR